jgi:hypothetical protein
VPRLVCTECGKVCRSDVEKAMHTRGTGHASYVDKVRSCASCACVKCSQREGDWMVGSL